MRESASLYTPYIEEHDHQLHTAPASHKHNCSLTGILLNCSLNNAVDSTSKRAGINVLLFLESVNVYGYEAVTIPSFKGLLRRNGEQDLLTAVLRYCRSKSTNLCATYWALSNP